MFARGRHELIGNTEALETEFSSGVYCAVLRASSEHRVNKLVLWKRVLPTIGLTAAVMHGSSFRGPG